MKKLIFLTIFSLLLIASLATGFWFFGNKNKSSEQAEAASLRSGLVGYWTMDANDINGTKVYDKSGQNNHGISVASPTQVSGKIGQALNYNSTTQHTSSTLASSMTGNVTIAAWIKITTSDIAKRRILDLAQASAGGIEICVQSGVLLLDDSGGPTSQVVDSLNSNDGKWHYVAVTRLGTTYTFYVDNRNIGSIGGTAPTYTRIFMGTTYNTQGSFNGSLDDVRIYNRALSAQEVTQLYNSSAKAVGTMSTRGGTSSRQLVGHWTMDAEDINGTKIYDKSGQNNSGILTGTANTTGKIKEARSLDGTTNSWMNMDNFASLKVNNGTISAWIKTSNAGSSYRGVAVKFNAYSMYLKDNVLTLYDFGASADRTCAGTLNDNKWHLILISFQSGVVNGSNCYIDGVLKNTFQMTVSNQTGSLTVGAGTVTPTQTFAGSIDDVRVYNYAMSAQEVANLYNSAKESYSAAPSRTGLIAYYSMNTEDVNGTTYYDKSGNNRNGTVSGTYSQTGGKIKEAINFTAGKITTGSDFIGTKAVTSCAWIYRTGGSGTGRILDNGKYLLFINSLINAVVVSSNGGTTPTSANDSILNNVWMHVCATRAADGIGTVNFYINGTQNGTANQISGIPEAGTTAVLIGNKSTDDRAFGGKIDDLRIYDRVLSAQEIMNLYNSSRKVYIK